MANKLTIANIATGEKLSISNAVFNAGNPYFLNKNYPTAKWCEKYHVRIVGTPEKQGAYTRYFLQATGDWTFVAPVKDAQPKAKAPKAETKKAPKAKAPKAEPTPTPTPAPAEPAPEPTPAPTPKTESAPKASKANSSEDELARQIAALIRGKGAQMDEEEVAKVARRIFAEECAKGKVEVVHKVQVNDVEPKALPKGQEPHPMLPTILKMVANDRIIGRYPYLYGPAGSGKSSLAKQVADAMGLPFYSVSSLQQKYELEGYTDAVGKLVETTFYTAFKNGGIYCFDEISTTSPEVQVAFNTAVAQLIYNFPKDGMLKAHKDFHIIAADNTAGRGGNKTYNARFALDASTLDRYTFVEIPYTEKFDLFMAQGDKALVEFMVELRKVLDKADTTCLATPRASKAIKMLQATGFSESDSLWYGLCSGWAVQDIKTFAAAMSGSNKYTKIFKTFANK